MTLTDHTFALAVTLKVTGAMEFAPEPLDHVHDAVKRLMEESEWLLEAIGHPHAEGLEVTVVNGAEQAEEAWMYRDLCK